MIPGIDPKVDYAFKKLFGSEGSAPVLLNLLNAVLKPTADQHIVSLEIINPFNDKETPDDKLSIVDVKARDQLGRLYNIEMQMQSSPVYPQRVLYYWAVLYGQQLRDGQDYPLLQPTISISMVNGVLFPQVADYHLDFQLRSPLHPELMFSAQQSIHVLELPKFHRSAEELTDSLDAWCYFMVHGADLDTEKLPDSLREAAVPQALEVLNIMAKNDLEWERYQARLKYQRDQNMYLKDARDEALKEGLEEGLKEGLEEGLKQGLKEGLKEGMADRVELCQRLLRVPLTARAELLSLPFDELRAKADSLQKQLGVATD